MDNKKIALAAGLGLGIAFLLKGGTGRDINIIDIIDELPKDPNQSYANRTLSQIERIVVHNTASSESATPEAIANYHVNTRGWAGIGYHYLIKNDGTIYQTNHLTTVSYHVGNANTKSIGISLIGNFEENNINNIQYAALIRLLNHLKGLFPTIEIDPHKKYANTACPGVYVMNKLFPGGVDSPAVGIGALTDESFERLVRCNDGTYSTAKNKPCSHPKRGGISDNQEIAFKKSSAQCLSEMGFEYAQTYLVPLDQIQTDEKSFQNRKDKFSKDSVKKIVDAVTEGKFIWGLLDPLILWRDTNGKLWVLSGHSRFSAFKMLSASGATADGRGFDAIPAKIIDTDFETARKIALNSNTLATPETMLERTYYYYALRENGTPETEIKSIITKTELANAKMVYAWTFLNPSGKAMDALRAFEGKDITSNENLKQITNWVGQIREAFPVLSNLQEDEIFSYLISGGYGKEYTNLNDLKVKIRSIIEQRETMFSKLDPNELLNLANIPVKSTAIREWEHGVQEIKQDIANIDKTIDSYIKRGKEEQTPKAQLIAVINPYQQQKTALQIKLQDLIRTKNSLQRGEANTPGLFGIRKTLPLNLLGTNTVQSLAIKGRVLGAEVAELFLFKSIYAGDYTELTEQNIYDICAQSLNNDNANIKNLYQQWLQVLIYINQHNG
jgi:hypothetical protein